MGGESNQAIGFKPAVVARWGLCALMLSGCYTGVDIPGLDESGGDASTGDSTPGTSSGGDSSGGEPADDGDGSSACEDVGLAQMRELTAREYDKTVQALLFTDSSPSQTFVADSRTGPFKDNSARSLVEPLVLQYQRAAEELSTTQDLSQIFPCDVEADLTDDEADACVDEFVRTFGALAYRRPLEAEEAERLLELYRSARTDPDAEGTFDAAARTVLEAILQSPYFLNHIRWGDPDAADEQGRIPLSSWELASRLSYFLWDAPPDEGLRIAAEQGALEDPEVLVEHAMRMVEDERAVETLKVFFDEWLETDAVLHTEKVAEVFPEFDEDLQQSLHHSLELFLEEVALNPDATLVDLLTANVVYVDTRLAELYGLPAGTAPDDGSFVRVEDPPSERVGIIGQAAILSSHAASWESSPLFRGLFIYDRLMCGIVAPPPDEIEFPEPVPGETPIELAERHMNQPGCNSCHAAFDPVGLAFEQYDSLGRFRTEYWPGEPASDKGMIQVGIEPELLGEFQGTVGLADILLQSESVHRCVSRQMMRFAIGSAAENDCVAQDPGQAFFEQGGSFRDLVTAVVRSEGFRFRLSEAQGE